MKKALMMILASDFLARGMTAATGFVLIRHMEVSQFATYLVINGFASIVIGALTGAFGTVYIVGHTEMKLKNSETEYLLIELLLAGFVTLCALPFSDFFEGLGGVMFALVITGISADFTRDYERQKLNFHGFAWLSMLRSTLFLIVIVEFIYLNPSLMTAQSVGLAQAIISLLCCAPMFRWVATQAQFSVMLKICKNLWHGHRYILLYIFFTALLSQIDVMLLKLWSTDYEIAVFGAAFRYYAVLVAILSSVDKVILPHLPLAPSPQEMRQLVNKIARALMLGLPVIAICALAAPYFLPWIDKGRFPESVATFQILCISAGLSVTFSPYSKILVVNKSHWFLFIGVIIGLVGNVVLNRFLIPRWGALGAAVTILVVFGAMNISFFLHGRQQR